MHTHTIGPWLHRCRSPERNTSSERRALQRAASPGRPPGRRPGLCSPQLPLSPLQPHHLLQPQPPDGGPQGQGRLGFPGWRRRHRFESRAVVRKVPDARAAEPVPRRRNGRVPYSVAVQLTQCSEGEEESGSKRSRPRPHPPSRSERIASSTGPAPTPCSFPFLFPTTRGRQGRSQTSPRPQDALP